MEYLSSQIILLAVLGMVIHALMFVLKSTGKNNKFSVKIWIKNIRNWIRMVLAVSSTLAILLMLDDIAVFFGMSIDNNGSLIKLIAFMSGYLNHAIIKRLINSFDSITQKNKAAKSED